MRYLFTRLGLTHSTPKEMTIAILFAATCIIIGQTLMKTSPQENAKQWIESWKRASDALKEVKQRELRAYDYEKNQAIVDGMLQWAFEHRKERLSSGLVEQQRLFMKMRSASNDSERKTCPRAPIETGRGE